MNMKDHYRVLAVYSLRNSTDREHFMGLLAEVSNVKNWHIDMVRPDKFFSVRELVDEEGRPFDGYILSMPGTDAVMKRLADSRKPTVLVNITNKRLSARGEAIASVWTDNADIGHRAAKHLLERGTYKSAGYVYGVKNEFYSTERMRAFREVMMHNGLTTSTFPGNEGFSDFEHRLREWLRKLPKPAAVMADSNLQAANVINACKAEGVMVPSQVAVIGVDNEVSQHKTCGMSISSVVLNMEMMGRKAVRELDFLFRHPKWRGRPHEILIPAKDIFVGESTARSISAMKLVNMAQDFITMNFAKKISLTDVAKHLGCSRQLIKLRFSQIQGMTIRQAIEEARMNEVELLLKKGRTVREIVKELQFTSPNQLYRIYKRHFGITISARRQQASD